MKTKTQDPKFYIEDDHLVGQSGQVPEDEPLFILRARDVNALALLCDYKAMAKQNGANADHLRAIDIRIGDFAVFAAQHPERMKVPDTDLSRLGKVS